MGNIIECTNFYCELIIQYLVDSEPAISVNVVQIVQYRQL